MEHLSLPDSASLPRDSGALKYLQYRKGERELPPDFGLRCHNGKSNGCAMSWTKTGTCPQCRENSGTPRPSTCLLRQLSWRSNACQRKSKQSENPFVELCLRASLPLVWTTHRPRGPRQRFEWTSPGRLTSAQPGTTSESRVLLGGHVRGRQLALALGLTTATSLESTM